MTETPYEERERRIAEKLARRSNRSIRLEEARRERQRKERRTPPDQQDAEARRHRERKWRECGARVTWLERPIRLAQGTRIFVTGVCSDADPAVAAQYGVKV